MTLEAYDGSNSNKPFFKQLARISSHLITSDSHIAAIRLPRTRFPLITSHESTLDCSITVISLLAGYKNTVSNDFHVPPIPLKH